MRLHRRQLLGTLSAAALAPAAGATAWGSIYREESADRLGDDQLPVDMKTHPERPLPTGLFDAYARNRQNGTANLITESFLVHALSLTRRRAQQAQEIGVLAPALATWVKALGAAATTAPNLPDLARDVIAVLAALQGGREAVAGQARALAEYDQVMAAGGIAASNLTGVPLDFTQFKPRAGYVGDLAREAYFRTFRYAGALAFLLVPSPATGVTDVSAAAMAGAAVALSGLARSEPARAVGLKLFAALEAAFGPADDYGPYDVPEGEDAATVRQQWIGSAAAAGRLPQVIDVIYDAKRLNGQTPAQVALSWRLLPGRRLGDIAALQQLVFPATGAWTGGDNPPFDAGTIDGKLVKAYVGLDDALALIAPGNSALPFVGLDLAQLTARQTLAQADDVSSPVMRLLRAGQAAGKMTPLRAHALAAAYVQHRHATVLVAKQSFSAADKSIRLAPQDRKGAILASTPAFVRALSAFTEGMAHHYPDPAWSEWSSILGRLEDIAWMQQRWGTGSTQIDKALNGLDLQMAELVDMHHDHPIVTDIHTCPAENKVVEIALARPMAIESGGAAGAALPACQFKQPIDARLTDEAWVRQLADERTAYDAATKEKPHKGLQRVTDAWPREMWMQRPTQVQR